VIAVALAAAALAGPTADASRVTAVGIGLREWQVGLYRERVRPGTVKFNITNLGQDAHDFAVRTRGGRILRQTRELRPGERKTVRMRIKKPARYTLICTLPEHEARGMKARLTVRRK
jgi:plastocyanin